MTHTLVPLDIETTGLSANTNVIVEFAMLAVTNDLEPIADFGTRVIHASEEDLDKMIPYVRDMHTETGLLDEIRKSTLTVKDVEDEALAWFAELDCHQAANPLDRGAMILGNSCRLDLNFIDAHMPRLAQVLHYRMIDMSGIDAAIAMWAPAMPSFATDLATAELTSHTAHRAHDDALMCLAQARTTRSAMRGAIDMQGFKP